jgi:hypothetical protein
MHVCEMNWTKAAGLVSKHGSVVGQPGLVLYFGSRAAINDTGLLASLSAAFPSAQLAGCSTGGHFDRNAICDDSVLVTAVTLDTAQCRIETAQVSATNSRDCGRILGKALTAPDLKAVLVLSDGLNVNGSDLVAGLADSLPPEVVISGGLAGDGDRFELTSVGTGRTAESGLAVAIGFFGESLVVATGSAGGWAPFGAKRCITRSNGNILHELDGQPALDLYERYLGEEAGALPASALLFPLRVEDPAAPGNAVVRTVLSVDSRKRSMTFAGDIPEGWTAQLMRGSNDRLAQGAAEAARQATTAMEPDGGLCVMISCIGRRLMMGQRAIDEVDAVCDQLAASTSVIGFYSYGEIAPHSASGLSQLHNQTMTVFMINETRKAA